MDDNGSNSSKFNINRFYSNNNIMAKIDKTYKNLLKTIINTGFRYEDPNRRGVYRLQIPYYQFEHSFKDGFPAITIKKLYWKGVVGELLWFLRGDTNIKYLVDNDINIWNKDAYNFSIENKEEHSLENFIKGVKYEGMIGNLGRIYGAQWRNFTVHNVGPNDSFPIYVDQISNLIKGLKENPMGTRHIVTAWNPAELHDMALPPCHWSFEILVEPLQRLKYCEENNIELLELEAGLENAEDCMNSYNIPKYQFTLKWHQRSVDTFLGLPFNIASYALLAHIIGKLTNMIPKGIIGDLSNVHIYEPHMSATVDLLKRNSELYWRSLELQMSKKATTHMETYVTLDNLLDNLDIKDFTILEYKSHPPLKAEMIPYDNN